MAATQPKIGMNAIRELICKGGGMAMSNTYKVTFEEDQRSANKQENQVFPNLQAVMPGFVKTQLSGDNADGSTARWISLMCDEATLPGSQFATGEVTGIYTGSGQFKYPHTRMFNDLTLSWVCDANMTPLKFLNTWMATIFQDETGNTILQKGSRDTNYRVRNRSVRLNYPDMYTMACSILKAEKSSTSELGRPSIRYRLEGVYPYAVVCWKLTAS
jgi:hypothetical protein